MLKLFELLKKMADDKELNDAIKKSRNFNDLAIYILKWGFPLLIAYIFARWKKTEKPVAETV